MQAIEHLLFFYRKVGYNAMQEECSLIQQSLWRLHSFDNDATRQGVQASILLRRQLFSSKYDHWQVAHRRVVAHALQYVEARHVWQSQVKNNAVERFLTHNIQCFGARSGDSDVNVVSPKQLANTQLLRWIVFNDKQPLPAG